MYTTWKLTVASIKMFVRNKQALFFTFFMPFFIMVIFGSIGFDSAPKINVGIAVQGNASQSTRVFVNQLRELPTFNLSYGSESVERKALEEDNRSVVLLVSEYPESLTILRNAGDPESQIAVSIISQILDKAALAASGAPQLVNLQVQEINSHDLKYIDFLLPGLVALSVMQLAVFSVAFVFVDFKEKGMLRRILATPVKSYQFVVANIITRLIVAVIQALFFIALGVLFFNVQVIGSFALIIPIVILGAIMFLGLGFTISGLSKTIDSVPAIANLVVFPMLFLGGTFFSIDSMPTWLQHIARYLPLTYFSTALRDVMTKGATLSDVAYNILSMIIWAIALVFLAILTFRFDDDQRKFSK